MYVNGVYSNVVPSTYAQVTYDAKGGSMAQGTPYSMYFDTAVTTSHIPAPIRTSQKFLGWYLGTEWKPSLTADCADKTLEAKWQPASLRPRNASNQAVSVNYKMDSDNLASDAVYNIPDASDDYLLDVDVPDTITVVREYIGDDGARWAMFNGRNNSVRWVMVRAGSNGAPSTGGDTQATIDVTVTVTNSYVNYRRNPSITSTKLGTFYQGKQARIINTANADGYQWGQVATSATDNTSVGWVALMYTNWNEVKNNAENKPVNGNVIALATITYSGYVNLRSGAGTDCGIVGSLANNETVEIYEIQTVNGHQWGRTNGGWFCLTYASLVMMDGNVNQDVSSEGALTYTFYGKTAADIVPLVSPSDGADRLERYYYIDGNRHNNRNRVDLWPAKGKNINISNMVVARDGSLWVKIAWRVDLNRDGAEDTTKYGWVKMAGDLSTTSSPVTMDPVKFTVVSDEPDGQKRCRQRRSIRLQAEQGR